MVESLADLRAKSGNRVEAVGTLRDWFFGDVRRRKITPFATVDLAAFITKLTGEEAKFFEEVGIHCLYPFINVWCCSFFVDGSIGQGPFPERWLERCLNFSEVLEESGNQ